MIEKTDFIFETKNLTQTFGSQQKPIYVLKDVSIKIPRGSFVIIYGPSGSGKSTLLNTIMGLQVPTGGKVLYNNANLYAKSHDELAKHRSQHVSTVYQAQHWIRSLSVLENVALPLYFQGVAMDVARTKALEQLKLLHMERHANTLPNYLSGGEQQRVAMARALVTDAGIIVADEPTGNLDTKNGDMIIRMLKHSQTQLGKTIILVTHELEYLTFGDQLFNIEDGNVTSIVGKDITAATNDIFKHVQKRIASLMEASDE